MRGEKGEMRRDREGRGIEERVMIRDRRGNRRGREVGMREEEEGRGDEMTFFLFEYQRL